jgi:hypothetical protein
MIGQQILVPSRDHSYREASIRLTKVVYNLKRKEYFEYHGEEFLEDGDIVKEVLVAD